jgi:hypothetical protein
MTEGRLSPANVIVLQVLLCGSSVKLTVSGSRSDWEGHKQTKKQTNSMPTTPESGFN